MASANNNANRSKGRTRKRRPFKMSGKFKCPECQTHWNSSWTWIKKSLRGNEYPAYGQQCNSCRGEYINPYEWKPLQCSICDTRECHCKNKENTHKSDLCGRCHSDDPCPGGRVSPDKPRRRPTNNKNRKPYRVYGWFECERCKNKWQSAYTWVRLSLRGNEIPAFGQECRNRNCRGHLVDPNRWEPLKCPKCEQPVEECTCPSDDESGSEDERPHLSKLCEKCQSKNPCPRKSRKKRRQRRNYNV